MIRPTLLFALPLLACISPAWAGGGVSDADVPAPHASTSIATPPAPIASAASSTDGCPPYEARNRAIPPRPRISASALLTHAIP